MIQHLFYKAKNLFYCFRYYRFLKNNKIRIKKCLADMDKKNNRVFIVGTGPSINGFYFSLIKDEMIIGVNTLYRGMDRFGIKPCFYLFSDVRVFFEDDNYKKVLGSGIKVFVSAGIYYDILDRVDEFKGYDNLYLIKPLGIITKDKFSKNIFKGCYKGHSVMIFALQFAYSMGFKIVYLVGVDYNTMDGNHFDGSSYSFKLDPSQYPLQFKKVFESYSICNEYFCRGNRRIFNLNLMSNLPVFYKKDISEVFPVV